MFKLSKPLTKYEEKKMNERIQIKTQTHTQKQH